MKIKTLAKKGLAVALSTVLVLGFMPVKQAQASDDLTLWVDGRYVTTDADPYIVEGRTLVPVRFVAQALGYDVKWNPDTRAVLISDDDDDVTIIMTIGSDVARHNGQETRLYRAPEIKGDRTFIPVRDIAERFGKDIDWDDLNKTVVIGQDYRAPQAVPRPGQNGRISAQRAIEIAKGQVNGVLTGFEYNDDDYEIEIYLDGYEYNIEIDARTGAIKEIERDREDDPVQELNINSIIGSGPSSQVEKKAPKVSITPDTKVETNQSLAITPDQARQIALNRAGGGTIVDFEYDDDEYEIEIRQGRYKIEIEIDARTGRITDFDKDLDD